MGSGNTLLVSYKIQRGRKCDIALLLILDLHNFASGRWGVFYNAIALAAVGRTPGKAIMGLLVVRSNGRPLHATQALLRAMVTSLVIVVALASPLGWIRRDRRQLHDLLACTTVIYAWDVRSFRLREADLTAVERLEPTYGSFDSTESWDEEQSGRDSYYHLHP